MQCLQCPGCQLYIEYCILIGCVPGCASIRILSDFAVSVLSALLDLAESGVFRSCL